MTNCSGHSSKRNSHGTIVHSLKFRYNIGTHISPFPYGITVSQFRHSIIQYFITVPTHQPFLDFATHVSYTCVIYITAGRLRSVATIAGKPAINMNSLLVHQERSQLEDHTSNKVSYRSCQRARATQRTNTIFLIHVSYYTLLHYWAYHWYYW